MYFIICQVRRFTGNIDGIFNRNILQNIQIPQFTANVLCGKSLEDAKEVLGVFMHMNTQIVDLRFCFCPEVRVLKERGGRIASKPVYAVILRSATYWCHHFFIKGEGDVGTVVLVVRIRIAFGLHWLLV